MKATFYYISTIYNLDL